MDLDELTNLLIAIGCPRDKAAEMAGQLDKRARQLAKQKNRSHQAALTHLIELMRQGWAAKQKGE